MNFESNLPDIPNDLSTSPSPSKRLHDLAQSQFSRARSKFIARRAWNGTIPHDLPALWSILWIVFLGVPTLWNKTLVRILSPQIFRTKYDPTMIQQWIPKIDNKTYQNINNMIQKISNMYQHVSICGLNYWQNGPKVIIPSSTCLQVVWAGRDLQLAVGPELSCACFGQCLDVLSVFCPKMNMFGYQFANVISSEIQQEVGTGNWDQHAPAEKIHLFRFGSLWAPGFATKGWSLRLDDSIVAFPCLLPGHANCEKISSNHRWD